MRPINKKFLGIDFTAAYSTTDFIKRTTSNPYGLRVLVDVYVHPLTYNKDGGMKAHLRLMCMEEGFHIYYYTDAISTNVYIAYRSTDKYLDMDRHMNGTSMELVFKEYQLHYEEFEK